MISTRTLALAAVAVASLGLVACGGSKESTVPTTLQTDPSSRAGIFLKVDAQMQAAIKAVEPKLSRTVETGQAASDPAMEATVKQAQSEWDANSPGTASVESSITGALAALAADFATPTVDVNRASADIGTYQAAATQFRTAASLPSSGS